MRRLTLISAILITLLNCAQSQVVFSSNAYVVCPSSPGVTVSLVASNFSNLGSLSVEMPYDASSIQFISYTASPQLSGGFMNANASGNVVLIAWFGLNTITIPNGSMLVDLHFNYITDSSYLTLVGVPGPGGSSMVIPGVPAIAQQPASIAINSGGTAQFSIVSQSSANTLYQWQVSSNNGNSWSNITNGNPYSNATTSVLNINPVNPGLNGYLYRCQLSLCQNSIYSNPATLIINVPPSMQYSLNYLNQQNSAITNTTMYLMQNFIPVYTLNTGGSGTGLLANITPGNFDVLIDCQKPWGGVNAVDALLIMKHFVGMITLNGLALKAADVDNSGTVNTIDAMQALQRCVGSISSFQAGDWQYDTNTINVAPTGQTILQVKTLCTGDVNGSYYFP